MINPFTYYRQYLGETLTVRCFVLWFFAVLIPTVAWHISQAYHIVGLIIVGLTPCAALFCFLMGLNAAARTRLYLITAIKAYRMGLSPTWGSGSGGYLLVDETNHLWAANGHGGHFKDITKLETDDTGIAYTISLHRKDRRKLIIGFDSTSDMEIMYQRFLQSLGWEDKREEEKDEEENK